jgi:Copper transport outer membrane protein, MctB
LIDFRYHLVSIVAVFLALAVGIIVGASAIQPEVVSGLKAESQLQKKNNETLRSDNATLNRQLNADDLFAQAASSYLLGHLLQGEQVVVVAAPGADSSSVTGITSALRQAGATVTGQVTLTSQFLDISASTEINLNAQARQLAPAGVLGSGSAAAGQIYGQQAAAQVIAAAIVHKDGPVTITSAESQQILTGFGQAGFLQVSGANGGTTLAGQATLAVVVIPASPQANASSPANLALVTFAHELQRASVGTLLAGSLPGSGTGSAIDAVTSGAAGILITTVDNANTAGGQVVVVWALRQMLDPHAVPTAYGVIPNAVPSPAPSTTPTPSPTPSHSPHSSGSVSKHPVKS